MVPQQVTSDDHSQTRDDRDPHERTWSRRRALGSLGAAVGVAVAAACEPVAGTTPTAFTMAGGGWGHGVGMSQWGAKGRADAGHSAASILSFYYPGSTAATTSPPGPRVLLTRATSVKLDATAAMTAGSTSLGRTVTLTQSGGAVMAGSHRVAAAGGSGVVSFPSGTVVRVGVWGHGVRYGRLRVRAHSSGVEVVLENISMDQFLYGLAEVSASWPVEALKAQAIAGRSYTHYQMTKRVSSTYDIHAGIDEAYTGVDREDSSMANRWVAAVDATKGSSLTYDNAPILALYHSSNGGRTERCENVFTAALPYFSVATDSYDAASGSNQRHRWTRTYPAADLGRYLERAGLGKVGTVTSIAVTGTSASGRIDKAAVAVKGTAGALTTTGSKFRAAVNTGAPSNPLYSTKFTIAPVAP